MTDAERGDDRFERLVEQALDALPAEIQAQLATVAIVVEDEATPEQLEAAHAHGLLGLYQGVPRTQWGADGVPLSSKITIFRGPIERAHRTDASLAAAVAEVVRHEIAHHLGISDARLNELLGARPGGDRPA